MIVVHNVSFQMVTAYAFQPVRDVSPFEIGPLICHRYQRCSQDDDEFIDAGTMRKKARSCRSHIGKILLRWDNKSSSAWVDWYLDRRLVRFKECDFGAKLTVQPSALQPVAPQYWPFEYLHLSERSPWSSTVPSYRVVVVGLFWKIDSHVLPSL